MLKRRFLEGMEARGFERQSGHMCEDIAIAFFKVLTKSRNQQGQPHRYPIVLSYPPDWGERNPVTASGDKTRA